MMFWVFDFVKIIDKKLSIDNKYVCHLPQCKPVRKITKAKLFLQD